MNGRFPSLISEINKLINSPFNVFTNGQLISRSQNLIYFDNVAVKYESKKSKNNASSSQPQPRELPIVVSKQIKNEYSIGQALQELSFAIKARAESDVSNPWLENKEEKKEAAPDEEVLETTFLLKVIAHGYDSKNKYIKITQRFEGDLKSLNLRDIDLIKLKEIFAQMVLAVYALHSKDLVHRDIKPRNFLFDFNENKEAHVILADLDTIAKYNSRNLIEFGTPGYLSPELDSVIRTGKQLKTTQNKPAEIKLKYSDLDKKAIDCYALGISFEKIIVEHKIAKMPDILKSSNSSGDTEVARQKTLEHIDPLDDLIASMTMPEPNTRLTIAQVMDHHYFGASHELRKQYFKAIIHKFKMQEIYFDDYYQRPSERYPQANNGFYALPKLYKEIYLEAADLERITRMCRESKHIEAHNSLLMHVAAKANKLYQLTTKAYPSKLVRGIQEKTQNILNEIPLNIKIDLIKLISISCFQKIVEKTYNKYILINKLKDLVPGQRFFEKFYRHGLTGKINAKRLLDLVQNNENINSPLQIYNLIHDYIENGMGGTGKTSFKTLLSKELKFQVGWSHSILVGGLDISKPDLIKESSTSQLSL